MKEVVWFTLFEYRNYMVLEKQCSGSCAYMNVGGPEQILGTLKCSWVMSVICALPVLLVQHLGGTDRDSGKLVRL